MTTLMKTVISLRPGVEAVMYGDDIEGIVYHTPGVIPVTRSEVDAEIIRLAAVEAEQEAATITATAAALAHAYSLGFTDTMLAVMYPNLVTGADPLVPGRESLNIPAKIDNNVTLDTVTP